MQIPESADYEKISERAKALESIKPDISSIIATVKSRVKPKIFHKDAGHEFLRMDVGIGPEEGYLPTPERDIGQYNLDIGDNEKMEELLRKLGVVGPSFKVKKSELFLELEKRGGGDFERDAIGKLVIEITGEHGKIELLKFSSDFFLKNGEVFGNINSIGYRHKRHWKFFGRKRPPELIGQKPSIEFFKRVGEIL